MKKNISRKDFLKGTACLALCPLILSSLNSCGDGAGSADSENMTAIASSEYESMTVGETKVVAIAGLKNGILLHKKSETEFIALNATCPHMQEPVGTDGVCTSGHGGKFSLETGAVLSAPPTSGLKKYTTSFKEGKLSVAV